MAGTGWVVRGLVALSAAVLGAALVASSASSVPNRTFTVRVEARDFAFKLSRRSVPAGSTVRFVVRNTGAAPHDFVVQGKKRTRILRPGRSQTITMSFPRKRSFRFLCSVSGHARLGMKGVFGVSTKPPTPEPAAPPEDTSDLVSLTQVGTFERPVLVTAPPGDTARIFVVEQAGTVRVVRDGEALPTPFLDIRDQVKLTSEPGLLSIAFAPDYTTSGRFYAFYNTRAGSGDIRISEFRRHPTDPDLADRYTERVLLTIVKPWENHNGGMLQFGPDGFLYASVGDGDSGVVGPPGVHAQRRDNLLGTIMRIDPPAAAPYGIPADNPFITPDDALSEIWAYGLRNPWRFWIDRETETMFIGDAGESQREELNVVRLADAGRNFGWPCFEGTAVFDRDATCPDPTPPAHEYARDAVNCAVIGGPVVRDPRLAPIVGRYLYGDFCSGTVTVVTLDGDHVTATSDLGIVVPQLSSFGVDGLDRVYAMSVTGGVFRLDPKRAT